MNRRGKFRLWVVYRKVFQRIFGFAPDIYMNDIDRIHFGKRVLLGPGVCVVTARHDLTDPLHGLPHDDVYVGDYSWIGAHAVILPGVRLGPHTIVGAGAVVTKSFPEGNVVLVGVPARALKRLDTRAPSEGDEFRQPSAGLESTADSETAQEEI